MGLYPQVRSLPAGRCQAKREKLERVERLLPESLGQNLALAVSYVLNSHRETARASEDSSPRGASPPGEENWLITRPA